MSKKKFLSSSNSSQANCEWCGHNLAISIDLKHISANNVKKGIIYDIMLIDLRGSDSSVQLN